MRALRLGMLATTAVAICLLATAGPALAGVTPVPTLTSPASNQVTTSTVPVSFDLPAAPTAGSVWLIFTSTTGGSTDFVGIGAAGSGTVSFSFDPEAWSLSPEITAFGGGGSTIPGGLYNVTLSYKDSSGDPAATSTAATNVAVDACGAGFYSGTGFGPCSAADLGHYVTGNEATSELPCPAGTFASVTASASCTVAPAGTFAPSGSINPTACTAGSYCPAQSGSPTPCPAGTFNPNTSASSSTACRPAAAGFYVRSSGASTETKCQPGTTTTRPGQTACTRVIVRLIRLGVTPLSHGRLRVQLSASTAGTFAITILVHNRRYGAARTSRAATSTSVIIAPARRSTRSTLTQITVTVTITPSVGGPAAHRTLKLSLRRHH